MSNPTIFIGSSTEGLEFAKAAKSALKSEAEVTLWNEAFFISGSTYIETLINNLVLFDFAILVLTPDDQIESKKKQSPSPRDNIIFELGLFMGYLGRSRTFVLNPINADIKLPTDLDGMVTNRYQWPCSDNNYSNAVKMACDEIRYVVQNLGISERRIATPSTTSLEASVERRERNVRELIRRALEHPDYPWRSPFWIAHDSGIDEKEATEMLLDMAAKGEVVWGQMKDENNTKIAKLFYRPG